METTVSTRFAARGNKGLPVRNPNTIDDDVDEEHHERGPLRRQQPHASEP
ncbi:hypothetical protein ACIRG5_13085 [Lentzea sp. NPDC102401]